jgi:hypothetical protein
MNRSQFQLLLCLTGFGRSWCVNTDVNLVLVLLCRVVVKHGTDVSEVYAASIFKVKVFIAF